MGGIAPQRRHPQPGLRGPAGERLAHPGMLGRQDRSAVARPEPRQGIGLTGERERRHVRIVEDAAPGRP